MNECMDALDTLATQEGDLEVLVPRQQHQPQPPPPRQRAARPPVKKAAAPVAFRASSADDNLGNEEADARAALGRNLFPTPPPKQRYSAAAKGKGRAVFVQDAEEEDKDVSRHDGTGLGDEEDYDEAHEEEENYGGEDDDDEEWEDPAGFGNLVGTTIDIASDDDDDEAVIAARVGGGGAVNATRKKGPPRDGSSPPKGSIYISTMRPVLRTACTPPCFARVSVRGVESGRVELTESCFEQTIRCTKSRVRNAAPLAPILSHLRR
jgi:hypothetical protein